MYQQLKETLRSGLGLSPDALLVFVGLGCFLAACLLARRPLTWGWALIPGVSLSLLLESLDVWVHYGADGLARAGLRDIAGILGRHAVDVLVMNAAPCLVLLAARLSDRRRAAGVRSEGRSSP